MADARHRLQVGLTPADLAVLDEVADRLGDVPRTAAARRAVALTRAILRLAQDEGGVLVVRRPDGTETRLVLL